MTKTKEEKDMHDFKKSLKEGQSGENIFDLYYDDYQMTDGKQGDFVNKKTGKKLELKTDSYDINKTENLFIEKWSDKYNKKLGGPWQAKEHNCSVYAYFFVKNGVILFYDLDKMLKILNKCIVGKSEIFIKNKAWITSGYKIARKDLTDALIKEEIINV